MKIPGIGEVKPVYAVGGGALILGVVGYAYYKNGKAKKAAAAAATTSAAVSAAGSSSGIDPATGVPYVDETGAGSSGIDPETGIPYADEAGEDNTYGGIDPNTGLPYYDEVTQSSTTTNPNAITTNQQWIEQAESDAQNLFGATSAVAQAAVEAYMSQTSAGLPANEYTLMQSVVGELGPPPTGSFRLIQSTGGTTGTTSGTGVTTTLTPGQQILVPYNINPPATVATVAQKFATGVPNIIAANPGLNLSANSTSVSVQVPWKVQAGQTLQSISTAFGIGEEHLAQILTTQGIV
jgi:LysM repeat protein